MVTKNSNEYKSILHSETSRMMTTNYHVILQVQYDQEEVDRMRMIIFKVGRGMKDRQVKIVIVKCFQFDWIRSNSEMRLRGFQDLDSTSPLRPEPSKAVTWSVRRNWMVKYRIDVVSISQTRITTSITRPNNKMSTPSFNNNNRTADRTEN